MSADLRRAHPRTWDPRQLRGDPEPGRHRLCSIRGSPPADPLVGTAHHGVSPRAGEGARHAVRSDRSAARRRPRRHGSPSSATVRCAHRSRSSRRARCQPRQRRVRRQPRSSRRRGAAAITLVVRDGIPCGESSGRGHRGARHRPPGRRNIGWRDARTDQPAASSAHSCPATIPPRSRARSAAAVDVPLTAADRAEIAHDAAARFSFGAVGDALGVVYDAAAARR